ncbi:MAG: 4Fe-4S ferredoxin [Negativicutes bacterium]|nr:4Fe-4S ferredoxin [Negativicutes bacterium]
MKSLDAKIELIAFQADDSCQHVTISSLDECGKCQQKPCLDLCPSQVFRWNYIADDPILVFYKQCIECGACRLVCPNIVFTYPRGGYGVIFRQG